MSLKEPNRRGVVKDYHRDSDGELLLDEDGDPIPLSVCICHAYEPSECGCECDSWEVMNECEG